MHEDRATIDLVVDLSIYLDLCESDSAQWLQLLTSHKVIGMEPKTKSTVKRLNRKIRDHDLIITKADKGNKAVILGIESRRMLKNIPFFINNIECAP